MSNLANTLRDLADEHSLELSDSARQALDDAASLLFRQSTEIAALTAALAATKDNAPAPDPTYPAGYPSPTGEAAPKKAPRAFRIPEPGTPWWQTAKDCGAWTDRLEGDVGYIHFGSTEALRVYTVKISGQAKLADAAKTARLAQASANAIESMREVLRISDRQHVAWDAAKAALAALEAELAQHQGSAA